MNYYRAVEPPEIPCMASWTGKGALAGEEARAGKDRKAAQRGLSYSQHGWPWLGAGQCIWSSSFHGSFFSLLLTKHAQMYVQCA